MKKTVNLTPAGKAELEQELAELIAQRPAIAERIATARAFGDLSENQEYTDARAEQKTVENRIIEIQEILKMNDIKKCRVVLFVVIEYPIELPCKLSIFDDNKFCWLDGLCKHAIDTLFEPVWIIFVIDAH